jgi:uncharacterized protein YsxB (DUF464 family)
VKLVCDALKSDAHACRNTKGKDAPPPLIVCAAFAGTAITKLEAAIAVAPAILVASAKILRTVSPYDRVDNLIA